ncbi:hypothetical protein POTOM_048527 [Populus tomentosa]|uniref:Uncharacterized protein n=1 Tax=Populus tomentosa TaxID=118781 RepID=A0A8X7Y909_POPTO|nr:hypothetical protein POTOM_048527 [Populus tomentosa]
MQRAFLAQGNQDSRSQAAAAIEAAAFRQQFLIRNLASFFFFFGQTEFCSGANGNNTEQWIPDASNCLRSDHKSEAITGEVLAEAFKTGLAKREDLFITTKPWNSDHGHVVEACKDSLNKL